MAVRRGVEVDVLVKPVDHLTQKRPRLHVVVGILEGGAQERVARGRPLQFLERREELVVDELLEAVAGHALGVGGPVAPAQLLWKRRAVIVASSFELLLLRVEDFQEQ